MSFPGPEALPDSPYAAELGKVPASARFAPRMEREFVRSTLRADRILVRVACVLALAIIGLRAVESLAGTSWLLSPGSLERLTIFSVAFASSLMLAWLAFSRGYERRYLSWAKVLVPLRNGVLGAPLVLMARAQPELLTVMPLLLIGPFFFLGLPFRTALFAVALTLISMCGGAIAAHLPLALALRVGVCLLATAVVFVIAAHKLEKLARRSFLEARVMVELAQHDPLTWTKNRRVFDEYLSRLWRQAAEDGRTIGVVLIDVDHFKPYNDRYGHQAGDQALRRVAHAIQSCVCRPLDLVARYGGEEFAAILYDVDTARATELAERIRRAVETLGIEHRGSRSGTQLTISAGVAVVEPTLRRNASGALQLADEALYQAKSNGRNRTEVVAEAEYRHLVTGVFSKEFADTLKRGLSAS
jgi:diguanylate cyclase (GGDEF)-like protein